MSVFALAAIAGVTTFFSPCAFPMFPGYMGLFLGLNAGQAGAGPNAKGAYKGAARRAAIAGSVTALGMILVFLLVGLALILAASVVSGYIPDLLIGVGVVLIALGGLLLTNLQYWRIVTPLQSLWYRMGGKRPEENLARPSSPSGKGFHLKLFGYGMGTRPPPRGASSRSSSPRSSRASRSGSSEGSSTSSSSARRPRC